MSLGTRWRTGTTGYGIRKLVSCAFFLLRSVSTHVGATCAIDLRCCPAGYRTAMRFRSTVTNRRPALRAHLRVFLLEHCTNHKRSSGEPACICHSALDTARRVSKRASRTRPKSYRCDFYRPILEDDPCKESEQVWKGRGLALSQVVKAVEPRVAKSVTTETDEVGDCQKRD